MKSNAQPISQSVSAALTEAKALQTKGEQVITQKSANFDWKFDTLGDAELERMLHAAKTYASAILLNESPHWLSLLGPSGVGKTHLSKRVLDFWRTIAGWRQIKGKGGTFSSLGNSQFISWRLMIDRIRSGGYGEVEDVIALPFVVIDDIGAEHDPNGFAKSILDKIADARLGKWTVFTCNLFPEQIAKDIDPRISSRMIRGLNKVIKSTAKDFNLRKNKTT